jgi:hypothetical protein
VNWPPGNFGRIIAEEGKKHPLWDREQRLRLFEKREISHKPSRLNATFHTTTSTPLSLIATAEHQTT